MRQFQKINYSLDEYKLNLPREFTNKKWYATEKLHGSNFSIYFDGTGINFAKRNSFLESDTDKNYYDFSAIRDNLIERTKKLFIIVNNSLEKLKLKQLHKIIVYGELIGGEYPGYELKPDSKPIQHGVFYSPNLEFFVFDVFIEGDQERFLTCDEFYKIVPQAFYTVPLLGMDKLNKLIDLDTKINSKIPNILDLETLRANMIEGIVIRECSNKEIKNTKIRPIIKIKNPEYAEIKKLDNKRLYCSKSFVDILVTKARLESVISKKDFLNKEQLIKKYILDAWDDYNSIKQNYKITDPNNVLKELDAQVREYLKDYRFD